MREIPVKQCPLNEEYLFKTRCRVKTCKYYSPTTPNRCLGMDIRFSAEDSPVSDAELLRYKFPKEELTVKDITRIRKKLVERVKSFIALPFLIRKISETYSESDGLKYVKGKSYEVDAVLASPPLSLPVLGFEPWMLPFLLDEKFVAETIGPKFKLQDALKLKTREYTHFVKCVRIMHSGNSLFDKVV